jgi:hypothetical protein
MQNIKIYCTNRFLLKHDFLSVLQYLMVVPWCVQLADIFLKRSTADIWFALLFTVKATCWAGDTYAIICIDAKVGGC